MRLHFLVRELRPHDTKSHWRANIFRTGRPIYPLLSIISFLQLFYECSSTGPKRHNHLSNLKVVYYFLQKLIFKIKNKFSFHQYREWLYILRKESCEKHRGCVYYPSWKICKYPPILIKRAAHAREAPRGGQPVECFFMFHTKFYFVKKIMDRTQNDDP